MRVVANPKSTGLFFLVPLLIWVALASGCSSAPTPSPAPTLGARPPAIKARYAGQEQRGTLGSYCWNGCADTGVFLIPAQPITMPRSAIIQFEMSELVAPHQLLATLFPLETSVRVSSPDPNSLALGARSEFARISPRPGTQFELQVPDRPGIYALSLLGEWIEPNGYGPNASYGFHIVVADTPPDGTPAARLDPKETLDLFMRARIDRKDSDVLDLLTDRFRTSIFNTSNTQLLQVSNPCWYRYEIFQLDQSAAQANARVRMYQHQWGGDVMGTLPQSWEQAVSLVLTGAGWRVDQLSPAENLRVEPSEPHGPTLSACNASR